MRLAGPRALLFAGALVAGAVATHSFSGEAVPDWRVVDYRELVDLRRLSHSGESAGELLGRLASRAEATRDEVSPEERAALVLLDPLIEPYAYVLPDAVDTLESVHELPWVEVGGLWRPGEPQPAWAELLRSRHYVVESDGAGAFRAFLPWPGQAGNGIDSAAAADAAWEAAWPVLRHVFAAERRRLAKDAGGTSQALEVEVRAFRHEPARTRFLLGGRARQIRVDDTRPRGNRPPLDLAAIESFLASGLSLEGARLDADGLRLLGSRQDAPPRILGRPLGLADFAVAYRAVFHGGLGEPYMSLDRGYAPQSSVVNYGGRLKDTALGQVSLLCDIRFKTFSLGLDIARGRDLRAELRSKLPGFRTHLERLAEDPSSQGMGGQQTRLWFYPDAVDLTVSPEGDVLVLRKVRMSAASERLKEAGAAEERGTPPWTRATVEAINRDYDALAGFFPELSDLDQVVRLLSLFTWLREASRDGLPLADLDVLTALELPELATPRRYPQLLAFNALPGPGSKYAVEVFDQVRVGNALDRVGSSRGEPLPALRRFERARQALDPQRADHRALLEELRALNPASLPEPQLDRLAYRAERLRMHQLVLGTLDPGPREELAARNRAGERLSIFSVGIGGLDLGMGQALERSRRRNLGGEADAAAEGRAPAGRTVVREEWRVDPPGLPGLALPPHGARSARPAPGHLVQSSGSWRRSVTDADGEEVRARTVFLDDRGRATTVERVEGSERLRYRFEADSAGLRVKRLPPSSRTEESPPSVPQDLSASLVLVRVSIPDSQTATESPSIGIRLEASPEAQEAEFPRVELERLVLGKEVDRTPGRPLPGLEPLPEPFGSAEALLFLPEPERWDAPWEHLRGDGRISGEEDPVRIARALREWRTPGEGPAAVVGVSLERSPTRWQSAPRPRTGTLLLPQDGFSLGSGFRREDLAAAWKAGRVASDMPASVDGELVVLVSAEPPSLCADRLRGLATDARLAGKLLAVWCLAGEPRDDLPGALLRDSKLAGLGVAETTVVGTRSVSRSLSELSSALAAKSGPRRVEHLAGPFLWFF